eukprot:595916-Amphidinium_carterae.1
MGRFWLPQTSHRPAGVLLAQLLKKHLTEQTQRLLASLFQERLWQPNEARYLFSKGYGCSHFVWGNGVHVPLDLLGREQNLWESAPSLRLAALPQSCSKRLSMPKGHFGPRGSHPPGRLQRQHEPEFSNGTNCLAVPKFNRAFEKQSNKSAHKERLMRNALAVLMFWKSSADDGG